MFNTKIFNIIQTTKAAPRHFKQLPGGRSLETNDSRNLVPLHELHNFFLLLLPVPLQQGQVWPLCTRAPAHKKHVEGLNLLSLSLTRGPSLNSSNLLILAIILFFFCPYSLLVIGNLLWDFFSKFLASFSRERILAWKLSSAALALASKESTRSLWLSSLSISALASLSNWD